METYWIIEEWVPPQNAIGGRGYWTALLDGRFAVREDAFEVFERIGSRRVVRLIKETRKVWCDPKV
jgi:hypothetical protein